jgi:hypothetical protein
MTRKQRAFINYVKRTRPKTISDLRPRFHARFLGEGAYRQTFEYAGLVIKFARHGYQMGREHALQEAKAVLRMHKDPKLLALKRYAPTILHFDRGRGVTIMPKYKAIRYNRHFAGFANTFECMLADLVPEMCYEFDNGSRNFGYNEEGDYVLLDAGLLGEIE